jgi:hypothetical protein
VGVTAELAVPAAVGALAAVAGTVEAGVGVPCGAAVREVSVGAVDRAVGVSTAAADVSAGVGVWPLSGVTSALGVLPVTI